MPLEKTYHDFCDQAKELVEEIDVSELMELLKSETPPLLMDVREPDETALGIIPDAITIPRGVLERDIARIFGGRVSDEDLDRPIVVYCAGGSRSLLAGQTLKEMGFTKPVSLRGGYRAWIVAAC
jgi:rhodanese-related sulfurtransferase